MRTIPLPFVLVLALTSAPCGDDREPMWIDLDIFSRHLRALDDDLRAHGQTVAAMTEAAPMIAAENGFAHQAREHAAQMAAMVSNMRTLCVHPDGSRPDLAPLSAALDNLARALTLHGSTMTMSRSPADARVEELRFQEATGAEVSALAARTAAVAVGAGAYTCELHN